MGLFSLFSNVKPLNPHTMAIVNGVIMSNDDAREYDFA